MPKGVFKFCLHIRNADEDLFFKGIDRGELGIVHLLVEVFKIEVKYGGCKKTHKKLKNETIWSANGKRHHTKPYSMRGNGTLSILQLKDSY